MYSAVSIQFTQECNKLQKYLTMTFWHRRLASNVISLSPQFNIPPQGNELQQIIAISDVTTTELSPPPRCLATTEPTQPSRCFRVCSAVFLGAVSWRLPSLRQCHLIPAWTWTHGEISRRQYRPPSPTRTLLHSQTWHQQAAATV